MDETKLIFHHVRVMTQIRKSPDFKSDFLDYSDQPNNNDSHEKLAFSGYLKTIDPITKSVILAQIDKSDNSITNNILILGHNVKGIVQSDSSSEDKNLNPNEVEIIIKSDNLKKLSNHPYYKRETRDCKINEQELICLQDDIISWLKKNRIPVELDKLTNDIIVADSVRIKVPYEHVSDYICPTRIVLNRIKHIVDSRTRKEEN